MIFELGITSLCSGVPCAPSCCLAITRWSSPGQDVPANPSRVGKRFFWGSAAAIAMRIVLTISAVQLLSLPYLKIVGAIFWVYIGVDLL